MKFWDTSALIPLLVDEPNTSQVEHEARADSDIIVWWGTRIECVSALARRERDGTLAAADVDVAYRLLRTLGEAWSEILPTHGLRTRAERLLRRHDLRAADALQLAAATVWSADEPTGRRICTLDRRLADAARIEGFDLPLAIP